MKEREELAQTEAELAEAQAGIEAAQAKFIETGDDRDATAIRSARERCEIAELRVRRAKTMLERAEIAATVAEKEARRTKWQQNKVAVEALMAKELPLIEAEAKLLLGLVDIRVARRNLCAETYTAIQQWKPLYLEFEKAPELPEYLTGMPIEQALEFKDPDGYRMDPFLSFQKEPHARPVIEAARGMATLLERPGKADPRGALLNEVLPSDSHYRLPEPPKVKGTYLEWIPATEVPRFIDEKKSLLGALFK